MLSYAPPAGGCALSLPGLAMENSCNTISPPARLFWEQFGLLLLKQVFAIATLAAISHFSSHVRSLPGDNALATGNLLLHAQNFLLLICPGSGRTSLP